MTLSLDELKVDSYAVQVRENELADVKGGSTPACVWVAVDIVTAIATVVAAAASVKSCSDNDKGGDSVKVTVTDSSTVVIHGRDTVTVNR